MHVVTRPSESFRIAGGALEVHCLPAARDNLVWLLVCAKSGEAAAVDGPSAEEALAWCEARGLRLTTVINTHTHGDHIGINLGLQERGLLESMRVIGAASRASEIPGLTQPVVEGDVIRVGGAEAQVWLTEGHIDGHLSYVFDGAVFCGDTLFTGGCGYLFDGPPEAMFRSLRRLSTLPPDTRVCCAHEYTQDNLRFAWSIEPGNPALAERIRRVWATRSRGGCAVPSTIGEERATNPFLRTGASGLRAAVEAAVGHSIVGEADMFAATRALKDRKLYRSLDEGRLPLG